LQVYDRDQKAIAGLPFRAGEVYLKTGIRDKHSKGEKCEETAFSETLSLPTGEQYFVSASTAELAKTSFTVKYTAAGGLQEVVFNSEPQAAETIKAVTEAVKVAASLGGIGPASAGGAPPCDAGEKGVKYTKFKPDA